MLDISNISKKKCFLCNIKLKKYNKSKEHIIPKWVQKEFLIKHNRIKFLIGKSLSLSILTVPCCYQCNQFLKKNLEDKLSCIIKQDISNVFNIQFDIITKWLIKIYYGILYKDFIIRLSIFKKRKFIPESKIKQICYIQNIIYQHLILGKSLEEIDNCNYILKIIKYNYKKNYFLIEHFDNNYFYIMRMKNIGFIFYLNNFDSYNFELIDNFFENRLKKGIKNYEIINYTNYSKNKNLVFA